MRPVLLFALSTFAVCMAVSTAVEAGGPNEANYPLRVHILKFNKRAGKGDEAKNLSDAPDFVQGMGVADLFENGQPQGFQFSYDCIYGVQASQGYSNVPARWKKKGKRLEILVPEPKKPSNLDSCPLDVEITPLLAFYWKDGRISEERIEVLKAWMVKHQYNPEDDQEDPVMAAGEKVMPGESSDPQLIEQ